MILKFSKSLNDKKEYTLIQIDKYDKIVDLSNFLDSHNVFETCDYYYFYINKIFDIGDCEKFKVIAKKGDIVSLTARDNSYLVFPSKKTFAIAFNLKYHEVLQYKYEEVLYEGKPYIVKYVKEKDDKLNDGIVYTLAQLCTYVSSFIKGYIHRKTLDFINKDNNDKLKRVITKYYDSKQEIKLNTKYELNVKRIWMDENNKWHSEESINVSNSNKYMYDYLLIRMFAYMILTKSKNDIETNNDMLYRFGRNFNTLDEVYDFLEENQDIVNTFFIENKILFEHPNSMITSYAPYISGIYMYYNYNNVKVYLYRNIDSRGFKEKSLKQTYVSTNYKLRIRGIKINYTGE